MMLITGITCEYNPFHNGHAYQLSRARRDGAQAVVSVMSGNFVQRGEPAVMTKRARAEAAVRCGVDLVIELPVIYSCAGAQRFAFGAVSLLDSLGCVSTVSFGSECGDLQLLEKVSDVIGGESFSEALKSSLSRGDSFAAARENAVRELCGDEAADILKNPNDILGIEYISAIKAVGSSMLPAAIKRHGVSHDSAEFTEGIASASYLRERIKLNEDISRFVPPRSFDVISRELAAGHAPSDMEKLETAMLLKLRCASRDDLLRLPDISEGLENRIISAARKAVSLDEFFELAKTKRYSHARVRRVTMSLLLGITSESQTAAPPYIRVLAFNETGREILRIARKTAKKPVVMRTSDIAHSDDEIMKRFFEAECKAADIYALTLPSPLPCGTEMTDNIFTVK